MNIEKIELPKSEAEQKLAAYKKRLAKMKMGKANREVYQEYKAALEGYKALAEGTPLLDLDDVMSNAPVDDKMRPKLAIARADRKQVHFSWRSNSTFASFNTSKTWRGTKSEEFNSLLINVSLGRIPKYFASTKWDKAVIERDTQGYALIPMVPADVRPQTGQLSDWFILWEVENWSDTQLQSVPDRDPYLLKHLHGSLYAILAEWDLTDLERSIMKGRIGT